MSLLKKDRIKVIIWGASGHALVIANILQLQRNLEIVGFMDDVNPERQGKTFCGKIILGGKEQIPNLRLQNIKHIALGFGNCSARIKLGKFLIKKSFQLMSIYHPNTTIANSTKIGKGTAILAGAVVEPECRIGDYCIVNTNSTICHNSIIGDGVHICPGVHIAGKVNIGKSSWIGIGSCVIDKITIGSGSFIGGGSVVVKDIPKGVLAYGNPARVIHPIDYLF